MTKKLYLILSASTIGHLETLVNSKLSEGEYEVTGGIAINTNGDYIQAMIIKKNWFSQQLLGFFLY